MTVISPALSLPTRVVVVAGRAAERLTERALPVTDATLIWQFGATEGVMPTMFHAKPGGYFALQLDPTQDYPDFNGAGTVTLQLTLTFADAPDAVLSIAVPEADLIPTARQQAIAGRDYDVIHLPGAPIVLNHAPDPMPVALEGQILINANPATPGAALDVTVGGTGPVTTDATGRFRTGPLPLTATVAVSMTDGADTTNITQPLDFTTALNRAIFSFQPED